MTVEIFMAEGPGSRLRIRPGNHQEEITKNNWAGI